MGMTTGEEDFVSHLFIATTHCTMLVFSTSGQVYWLKVHEIPQIGRTAKGKAITNLINMPNTDSLAAILSIREFSEGQYIVMATKNGVVKKTDLMEYSRPRAGGIIGITLDEKDAIVSVRLTDGKQDILLSTKEGQAIRFKEEESRPIGRVSRGVRGITLGKGDEVVSMETFAQQTAILSVTRNGYGKRTDSEEYRVQGRGGGGIITIKTTDRNGPVVGTMVVGDTDDVMLVTDGGKVIRTHAKDIPVIGRNTQGVRLINLETGEHLVSFAKLLENDDEGE
jgi:DNA gyrase subunit A